jgi:hypothetical protein
VIVATFPHRVRVIEHTLIPLKDGTRLAARIWLPEGAERSPIPAILIERIERLGLELGTKGGSHFHVEEDDPLSAVVELRRTLTMSREAWHVGIETWMRLSCTRDAFRLQGSLRAREGTNEVCHREWDRAIPRDFM